jgi:exodeoxyribonuclease V alpha subunit
METLSGKVERIRYRSDETGYTVMTVTTEEGEFTLVCHAIEVKEGDSIRAGGQWVRHKKYGRQFQAAYMEVAPPSDEEGLFAFLTATVKGIGASRARAIIDRFGMGAIEVMDNQPERLREVPGIGKSRLRSIIESWEKGRAMREVMIWLQKYGITPGYAVKIWKAYGEKTMETIKENPYRIADDIWGIGFRIADRVALQLGVPRDSPMRVKACILHVLKRAAETEGHVFLFEGDVLKRVREYIREDGIEAEACLGVLGSEKRVVIEPLGAKKAVYHSLYFRIEENAARRIFEISTGVKKDLGLDAEKFLLRHAREKKTTLSPEQEEALRHAAGKAGLLVITGLPGTGKTSVCKALLDLYEEAGLEFLLSAPTGRAAERLGEATGRPAKTIHRLLGYNGTVFEHNRDNPIECGALLVDESSMVDIALFNSLLEAVRAGTRVVLIGDTAQLPSVGPGNVLRDVISSGCATVVTLTTIFRQAASSPIVLGAHRINEGKVPEFSEDFAFYEAAQEEIPARLRTLVPELMKRYGDVQVLCPMNKGTVGIGNINRVLQEAINPMDPEKREVERGFMRLRTGDRIIQLKNNYKKDVYNGTIGQVTGIDKKDEKLFALFQGKTVEYDFDELDEIRLAYCISIHKSQGSEFRCVVLCLVNAHYIMLRRKLIYTAVTRARERCVIMGEKRALQMAIRNVNEAPRNTMLARRVQEQISSDLQEKGWF